MLRRLASPQLIRGGLSLKQFVYKRKRTLWEDVDAEELQKERHDQVNPPQVRLVFLGTSSMAPTKSRNVTSSVLQLGGVSWMFDCGEGTQHQVQKCKYVRSSSVSRIYITHLHGDHFYGLPGFMCSMCNNPSCRPGDNPVEIIGPPGIRHVLRVILKASMVQLSYRYVVHELHGNGTLEKPGANSDEWLHPQEVAGKDIFCDTDGCWKNIPSSNVDTMKFAVHAAPLKHSTALDCLGFVIQERDYPGKLDMSLVEPLLKLPENRAYFKNQGINNPLKLMGDLKCGTPLQLHDRVIMSHEVLGPEKRGRKIAILGDTYDSSSIAELAANADILVHEATNAYLPQHDPGDATPSVNYFTVLRKTLSHGHSIPQMAGSFAQSINARHLILTHLSPRYQCTDMTDENETIAAIRNLAKTTFTGEVSVAHDFRVYIVPGSWQQESPSEPLTWIDPADARAQAQHASKVYHDRIGISVQTQM